MPIDQLRNMLFIGLLLTGFLIWQAWQEDYGPKAPPALANTDGTAATDAATPSPPPTSAAADASTPASGTSATDVPSAPGNSDKPIAATTAGVSPAGNVVAVTTDLLQLSINLAGGGIEELKLRNYPTSVDDAAPFTLMFRNASELFVTQSGLLGSDNAPNHQAQYSAPSKQYELGSNDDELRVVLTWNGPGEVAVEKHFVFTSGSYVIGIEHHIRNTSSQAWSGRMYGQFQRTEVIPEGGLFRTYTYTGGVLSDSEKPYEKIDFDDMASNNLKHETQGGWVGMIQHYFAAALVPESTEKNYYYSTQLPAARYALGVMTPATTVAADSTGVLKLSLYAGPKDRDRLLALAPNLERTVDYGWLWFIAEPLFIALRWIHGVLGNWGFSIIVLTLVIKALFFHLSAASYKSMARMRKLQPRIVALRERYASDKARMNQAMMELYKEEKINPLGGCLPILVQIPVFIALYWVLLESVELRQAPFMLWIRDLSEHDPYFVLPLLMGASMFIQQRLNPAPPDPIQAKVMMALPIVFTFLFLFFPSGLVLYWFVNNLLSIAQQWVITRKIVGPDG